MKTYNQIMFIGLMLGFMSCNNNSNKSGTSNSTDSDTLQPKTVESAKMSTEFNLDQVPVSTIDLGTFPYLTAPESYRYSGDIKKQLEEKYFFYNDSLVRKVSGEYFHTTVLPTGDVFEDTFVVDAYKKAIEKLGGVEIYSGGISAAVAELIDKEKPAYVDDMYDPMPYKYKQFLIRTPNDHIWIELCHGLNAQQVDLAVVKEVHGKGNEH
ncbi:hypothetical protein [Sphingobacterium sp. UDSM-2020]|uniref:hypothetical protein n=1 Tax=Sphingobacterium sp. UDSM-2020 TaxID=2795738 RepID=UPI00193698A2|nr:hypothetical protein [Sphingobacterium sp. UDSM-2020]QQD14259.1 hypothetical protein JAZ75_01550 [Sphingobacterium sp. UDSM-2020]